MPGRTDRADKNRKKILDAALALFQSQGLKRVSVSDIARQAGVTPATVYNRFGSKDALVREVIINWYSETLEDYKRLLNSDLPFEEKLRTVLSFKSDLAGKIHGEFLLATTADDPEMRRYFESEYMVEFIRCVNEFYDEGKRQGYINPDLSTETILRFNEVIRQGLKAETDLAKEPGYAAKLLRELTPIFLYGILGRQDKKGDR